MSTITIGHKHFNYNFGSLLWFIFIFSCLIIGISSAIQVFTKGLTVTNMSDSIPWGLWITIDLSSIALGAGAFTLSAIVYIFGIKRFQPVVRLAVLIGFIGYSSALITLIMDIGRPDRFWHPWVYWNIHSVLWEITWCITIYLSIMILEFLPVITETKLFIKWPWIATLGKELHKLAPFLALIGVFISLLHQSSLGATYGIIKSRPIWFKPSMPIMFILSAVGVGPALTMAVAIAISWIQKIETVGIDILRAIARFSGYTLLIYGYIRFWDLLSVSYYGRTPSVDRALNLLNQQTPYNFSFWIGEVLIGLLIPTVMFLSKRFNISTRYLFIGSLCALFGLIINRWNVTVTGLFVPLSYSPGTQYTLPPGKYFPSIVEWGVVFGIIGYASMLISLGVRYLPLFDNKQHHRSN